MFGALATASAQVYLSARTRAKTPAPPSAWTTMTSLRFFTVPTPQFPHAYNLPCPPRIPVRLIVLRGARRVKAEGQGSLRYIVLWIISHTLDGMIGPIPREEFVGLNSAEGRDDLQGVSILEGLRTPLVKAMPCGTDPSCLAYLFTVRGRMMGPVVNPSL